MKLVKILSLLSLFGLILSLGSGLFAMDQNGKSNQSQDDQYQRETESKQARAAQRERDELQAIAAIATQEANSKLHCEGRTEQDVKRFEDANAILFELTPKGGDSYTGPGLPKNLQYLVFDMLQEVQHKGHLIDKAREVDTRQFIFTPDKRGNNYITAHIDWDVLGIFNCRTGNLIAELPLELGDSNDGSVACQIDRQENLQLVSGDYDQSNIRIWNVTSGELVHTLPYIDGPKYLNTHADHQGNWYIISASEKNQDITIWNGATGNPVGSIKLEQQIMTRPMIHADSGGKWYIIARFNDYCIRIWDGITGKLIHTLEDADAFDQDEFTTCNDSQGNWYVISVASENKAINIWNGVNGNLVHELERDQIVKTVKTHTDKQGTWYVIATYIDNSICVWNGITGKLIHTLVGHTDFISDVGAYNTGSDWHIISASRDETLRFWHGFTGECISTKQIKDWVRFAPYTDNQGNLTIITNSVRAIHRWDFVPSDFEREKDSFIREIKRRREFNKNNFSMEIDHNYNWDYPEIPKNHHSMQNNGSSSSSNSNGTANMDTRK